MTTAWRTPNRPTNLLARIANDIPTAWAASCVSAAAQWCGWARAYRRSVSRKVKPLSQIQRELVAGRFEFSRHAFRRAVERNIGESEIREAGERAELIEIYPADKYSPSALLLGFTAAGRALHIQVSLVASESTKIITIYEPDPKEWIDHRKRR